MKNQPKHITSEDPYCTRRTGTLTDIKSYSIPNMPITPFSFYSKNV
jgi:hypothetical protein